MTKFTIQRWPDEEIYLSIKINSSYIKRLEMAGYSIDPSFEYKLSPISVEEDRDDYPHVTVYQF